MAACNKTFQTVRNVKTGTSKITLDILHSLMHPAATISSINNGLTRGVQHIYGQRL